MNFLSMRLFFLFSVVGILTSSSLQAQSLRFDLYRDRQEPDWATRKSGDFYSTLYFTQQLGVRYTKSNGSGTDYLFGNSRGTVLEDGEEFPLVTSLQLRNYWILHRTMDLDMSLQGSYYHYPMDTQEDDFIFNLSEEGIFATFSLEFAPSDYFKVRAYDNPSLLTEYVDARGLIDNDGGSRYERFINEAGLNADWLIAKDQNLGASVERKDIKPLDDEFDFQEGDRTTFSLTYEKEYEPYGIVGATARLIEQGYADRRRSGSRLQEYFVFTDLNVTDFSRAGASFGVSMSDPEVNSLGDDEVTETIGNAFIATDMSKRASHRLSYSRALSSGFLSANELQDIFRYNFGWVGDFWRWDAFYNHRNVDALSTVVSGYADNELGITGHYSISKLSTLRLFLSLNERDNEEANQVEIEGLPADLVADYDTMRADVSIYRDIMENLTAMIGFGYVDRDSDSTLLDFDRMTYFARLTYRQQF
jgi:hypothetical protein